MNMLLAETDAEVKRPNIILILADDLGFSDIGCYGGEIKTLNLDSLAANGIRFTQFYNTTRCCPSRASINTGLYPHQAGIGGMAGNNTRRGYEGYLTDRCITLAEVLKTAGYRTYMSGKWHMNNRPNPTDRGFDEFFGLLGGFTSFFEPKVHTRLPTERPLRQYKEGEYYATDVFTDYAIDFLADSRKKDADGKRPPFFLYLAYTAPHFPLHAPKEEIDKYANAYLKGWDKLREERYAKQRELGIFDETVTLTPRSNIPKNWVNADTGWADKDNPAWDTIDSNRRIDLARRMAIFAAMIDRMDQNIGRVINDLKVNGDLDNTLIIFLSDNGACAEWDPWGFDINSGPQNVLHTGVKLDEMGSPETYHSTGSGWANASNTPWRLYKHYIHEGGIRTPMIAHWPQGIARKGEFEKSVSHIVDFMPTVLELSGANYPTEFQGKPIIPMEGRSLVKSFEGKQNSPRTLFWEHEGNRGMREGDTKLVWVGTRAVWELYDLAKDPMEMNDLASEQSETVEQMAEAWENWAYRALVIDGMKADKQPGLKLALDLTKQDNFFRDISGNNNAVTRQGEIPMKNGGRYFDGDAYLEIPHSETQHCEKTALTIEATIVSECQNGVILACGGSGNGYSLALCDGTAVFAITTEGRRYAVQSEKPISGKTTIRGRLNAQRKATLEIDGQIVATLELPDLIAKLPNEIMQIGIDLDSRVNSQKLPGFVGVIESVWFLRGENTP